MNKVIYINDENVDFEIKENETLEIYHYVVDKNVSVNINLNGEFAKVKYHLGILGYGSNKCSVKVEHKFGNTSSEVICHGVNVLDGVLEFDITGIVPKEAYKVSCLEENHIVNLSNGVGVIKPNLLIRNYDTFSKHAAYIGEFNKDKMFYLMSRGISKINATKLMMEALLIGNGNKKEMIVKEFMNKIMEVSNG